MGYNFVADIIGLSSFA